MGIPRIDPYPLPTSEELPENTVDWCVDPGRATLLIHDMQHYFVRPFPSEEPPITTVIDNIARLRTACRELGIPVVYSVQPGSMTASQRGLLHDFWGPGMSTDSEHRGVVDRIAPEEGDEVVVKWRYSALHRTDLLARMRANGRDQIVCCGVYAYTGVLMTAVEAFSFDVESFLVADAIADFTESDHALALRYAASRCARVQTTEDLLGSVTSTTDAYRRTG